SDTHSIVSNTSEQLTIPIKSLAAASPLGYDLNKNRFSFQFSAPFIPPGTATSFSWTGQATCGQSAPFGADSGSSYMSGSSIGSQQMTVVGNGFHADLLASNITANRQLQLPDVSDKIV